MEELDRRNDELKKLHGNKYFQEFENCRAGKKFAIGSDGHVWLTVENLDVLEKALVNLA